MTSGFTNMFDRTFTVLLELSEEPVSRQKRENGRDPTVILRDCRVPHERNKLIQDPRPSTDDLLLHLRTRDKFVGKVSARKKPRRLLVLARFAHL